MHISSQNTLNVRHDAKQHDVEKNVERNGTNYKETQNTTAKLAFISLLLSLFCIPVVSSQPATTIYSPNHPRLFFAGDVAAGSGENCYLKLKILMHICYCVIFLFNFSSPISQVLLCRKPTLFQCLKC